MKLRTFIILLLLCFASIGFSFQSQAHIAFGKVEFSVMESLLAKTNIKNTFLAKALEAAVLVKMHQAEDLFINEGGMGNYQVPQGILAATLGWMITPEAERNDYFFYSFWSLFPDIWDKGLNRNDFHKGINANALNFDRDTTQIIETLATLFCSFSIEIKF